MQFAELVKKIGTSTAPAQRKRKKAAIKKLNSVIKEQRRLSKNEQLRAVAITLTYSQNKDFATKHISAFLDSLRRTLKRNGHSLPYIWVLESAGRLHYHLMLWLPRNYIISPDKLNKFWPWGSTWIKSCRSPTAWGRYIAKFDSIPTLPKGSRLLGYGGLDTEGKVAVRRAELPKWLSNLLSTGELAKRVAGGGWVNMETGEWYQSPYIWTPQGIILRPATRPTCHPAA